MVNYSTEETNHETSVQLFSNHAPIAHNYRETEWMYGYPPIINHRFTIKQIQITLCNCDYLNFQLLRLITPRSKQRRVSVLPEVIRERYVQR